MRKILQQGQMDGFCLLYAVLNGLKTIKYPNLSAAKFALQNQWLWEELLSVTPSLHNFSCGKGSSFGLASRNELLAHDLLLKQYSALIKGKKREVFQFQKITLEDISTALTETSVVLLSLSGDSEAPTARGGICDHWLCVVDMHEQDYLLACSYIDYLDDRNEEQWTEKTSLRYRRPFNNSIARKDANNKTVLEDYIYKLVMEAGAGGER